MMDTLLTMDVQIIMMMIMQQTIKLILITTSTDKIEQEQK
jgi:hypothetical protein